MNFGMIGFNGKMPINISKLPLVEIVGEKRVLVENHLGVIGYW